MRALLKPDDPILLAEVARQEAQGPEGDRALDDDRRSWSRLHRLAVASADRRVAIQAACQRGLDVNAATEQGDTPLHMAAWGRRHEHLDHLLALGADVHRANAKGNTALHQALRKRDAAGALALLRAGSDLAAADSSGVNGLSYLVENLDVGERPPAPTSIMGQIWAHARRAPLAAWEAPARSSNTPTVFHALAEPLQADLRAWRLEQRLPQESNVAASAPRASSRL